MTMSHIHTKAQIGIGNSELDEMRDKLCEHRATVC
jgi:hypothetical protein